MMHWALLTLGKNCLKSTFEERHRPRQGPPSIASLAPPLVSAVGWVTFIRCSLLEPGALFKQFGILVNAQ